MKISSVQNLPAQICCSLKMSCAKRQEKLRFSKIASQFKTTTLTASPEIKSTQNTPASPHTHIRTPRANARRARSTLINKSTTLQRSATSLLIRRWTTISACHCLATKTSCAALKPLTTRTWSVTSWTMSCRTLGSRCQSARSRWTLMKPCLGQCRSGTRSQRSRTWLRN